MSASCQYPSTVEPYRWVREVYRVSLLKNWWKAIWFQLLLWSGTVSVICGDSLRRWFCCLVSAGWIYFTVRVNTTPGQKVLLCFKTFIYEQLWIETVVQNALGPGWEMCWGYQCGFLNQIKKCFGHGCTCILLCPRLLDHRRWMWINRVEVSGCNLKILALQSSRVAFLKSPEWDKFVSYSLCCLL